MKIVGRQLITWMVALILIGTGIEHGQAQQRRMSIATGSTGGVYYLWGGALAQIWNNHVPGVFFNVEVTTGQVPNVQLLEKGDLEVAMWNTGTAWEAWNQLEAYSDRQYRSQRAIFGMYASGYVMLSLADSDIDSIDKWEGKRVAFGTPGGTIDVVGRQILNVLGIRPARIVNSGWPEVPGLARDGLIDAIGAIGGQPWPPIVDLETTHKVRFYEFTDEQIERLMEAYPYFRTTVLPAGTYENMTEDYRTLAFWNMVVVRHDLPDDLVYQMVKVVFENKHIIETTHPPTAAFLRPESVVEVSPVPLHPGAIRYYEEQGIHVPPELYP